MRAAVRVRVAAEPAASRVAPVAPADAPVHALDSELGETPAEPVGTTFSLSRTPVEPLPLAAPERPALVLLPGSSAQLTPAPAAPSASAHEPSAEMSPAVPAATPVAVPRSVPQVAAVAPPSTSREPAPHAESATEVPPPPPSGVQMVAPRVEPPSPPIAPARTPPVEAPAPAVLAAAAAADAPAPVPDRVATEMALGRTLGHVAVFSGPATRAALGALDAEGAAAGSDVFVTALPQHGSAASEDGARATLAHELVHAADTTPRAASNEGPLATAAREQAAEDAGTDLAAAVAAFHTAPSPTPPPPPDRAAPAHAAPPPGTAGLRRQATEQPATRPEPLVGSPDAAGLASARVASAAGPAPSPAERAQVAAAPAARRPPATERTGGGDVAEAAPPADASAAEGLTELPPVVGSREVDVPAPPPPPLEGQDVDGLTAAFVIAAPSQKAFAQDTLGARLDAEAQEAADEKNAALPDLHETMGGDDQMGEVDGSLLDPDAGEADLLDVADEPVPEAEDLVPAAPENEEFDGNDSLYSWLRNLFGSDSASNAESIDEAIDNVETVDESVETSPGAPPPVPLEGATDPALIAAQQADGLAEAGRGRDGARTAVVEGPGPEVVQPRAMDESVTIPAIEQAPIEQGPPIDGIETYKRIAPPEDVQAAFDEQNAATMEASLGEANTAVAAATQQRDTDWDQAAADAAQQNQELVDTAQRDQELAVDEQRGRIQEERQHTLDRQQEEVDRVTDDAGDIREDKQGEIDDRVATDEARIEQHYTDAETEAQQEVDKGEEEAEREKRDAEREAEDQSWWDQLASWISDAISALVDVITAIIDLVADAVNAILDAVRDLVVGLIELAADFIKGVISAFGEVLKGLVDALLGEIFPELAQALKDAIDGAVSLANQAVDAAAGVLIDGVNAVLDVVQGALNAALDVFKGAIMLAGAIIGAALTGDWGEVGRLILEGALSVAGISPEEFYGFIGRVQETFDTIVNDPMGFLGNVFGAIALGFNQFVEHIVDHLQAGFFEWLVGPLGEMGITLPETWDLWGILGLVLQVLGLTRDGIRGVIVEELGDTAGVIFDYVWRYVDALITGGWQGLWEQIQNDLSDLWTMVVDGVKNWIIEKIITEATLKLLSLLDPTGISAIVQVVLTGYRIYTFMRDNLARVIQIVTTVVNAIHDIAMGNLQPAGDAIEGVLARLVPIVISLLANLFGIGGITAKVREVIEGIRERVRNALRGLIRRVRGMFTGGDETAEEQPPAGEEGWWNSIDEPFTTGEDNEPHTAEVVRQGDTANVVIHSDVKTLDELAALLPGTDQTTVQNMLVAIRRKVNTEPADEADRTRLTNDVTTDLRAVVAILHRNGLPDTNQEVTQVTYLTNPGQGGIPRAHRVMADPLTSKPGNTTASGSTSATLGYENYVSRLFNRTEPRWSEHLQDWVNQVAQVHRTHLLAGQGAHNLHGPNESWNIVCAHTSTNSQMHAPEGAVHDAVNNKAQTATYSVTVDYHEDTLNDADVLQLKDEMDVRQVSPTPAIAKKVVGYYYAERLTVDYQIAGDTKDQLRLESPLLDSYFRGGPAPPTIETDVRNIIAANPTLIKARGQIAYKEVAAKLHKDNQIVLAAFPELIDDEYLVTESGAGGTNYFVKDHYVSYNQIVDDWIVTLAPGTPVTQALVETGGPLNWRTIVRFLATNPRIEKIGRSFIKKNA